MLLARKRAMRRASPRRVTIAGGSGFVGRALVHALSRSHDHDVTVLSRLTDEPPLPGVVWQSCDLFNLRDAEHALGEADVGVYLVRSTMAAAHLTQGSLDDLDLICADNFARAAARSGVRLIVYLGCLLPSSDTMVASSAEIERTLRSHGVPLTTLRAGPIDSTVLTDVVELLTLAIERPDLAGQAYDIIGSGMMSSAENRPTHAGVDVAHARWRLHDRRVRSVQRLRVRGDRSAAWVAEEYVSWLPRFFRSVLRVAVDDDRNCRFFLWPVQRPLLVLTFATDRSSPDRQLFFVTGGLLLRVSKDARPRLEFRSVLDGAFVLAAIHDFLPRLPWLIYKYTQALVHLFVMRAFARHLEEDIAE